MYYSINPFDPRAHKCLFLGYAPNQLYDLNRRINLISGDVTFKEDVFSYMGHQPDLVTCPIPQMLDDLDQKESINSEHASESEQ